MRPVPSSLRITASAADPSLLDLPWSTPLEEWPTDILAALPRGISRHIVRFINLSGRVLAVKEIGETVAHREYELLRELSRLEAPSVLPIAVVTGRQDAEGEPLAAALITEHLQYSLPYRSLFSRHMTAQMATRLIDALAVLLVRLHLLGFFWGDVSLSNTLFRRDAGAFSAYLVDAETGELHPSLTIGQRRYDVDLARTNIIGELMDLQAGGYLREDSDVIDVGNRIVTRYYELWSELTASEKIETGQRWRVTERIDRLNALGFNVGELTMTSDQDGTHLTIQPKVVDAGHYHRQIMRLTGMDVGELQAQRMLNDLETYRAMSAQPQMPLEMAAHHWMNEVFEPVIQAIPNELRQKLEPAQVFHEVLDHRWYMAQERQHDVPLDEVIESYLRTVLPGKRDEQVLIDADSLTTTTAELEMIESADTQDLPEATERSS